MASELCVCVTGVLMTRSSSATCKHAATGARPFRSSHHIAKSERIPQYAIPTKPCAGDSLGVDRDVALVRRYACGREGYAVYSLTRDGTHTYARSSFFSR